MESCNNINNLLTLTVHFFYHTLAVCDWLVFLFAAGIKTQAKWKKQFSGMIISATDLRYERLIGEGKWKNESQM